MGAMPVVRWLGTGILLSFETLENVTKKVLSMRNEGPTSARSYLARDLALMV